MKEARLQAKVWNNRIYGSSCSRLQSKLRLTKPESEKSSALAWSLLFICYTHPFDWHLINWMHLFQITPEYSLLSLLFQWNRSDSIQMGCHEWMMIVKMFMVCSWSCSLVCSINTYLASNSRYQCFLRLCSILCSGCITSRSHFVWCMTEESNQTND